MVKELTVQFRAGELQGETYQACWEDSSTFLEVITDAAAALGVTYGASPWIVTRNVTNDAEERNLDSLDALSTEPAMKFSIAYMGDLP